MPLTLRQTRIPSKSQRWCQNGVSQDRHPRKSILRKKGTLGSNHTVKFTRSIWHHDIQASGIRGDGRSRKGRSSSLASHSKAKQTDGEERKSPEGSGKNRKTRSVRVKFLANSISVKIRHVSSGIFPCQKYNFYPRRFST